MADVTSTIDSSGNATNPGVAVDQTIQWVLGPGVTGPFALNPPNNIFKNDDSPNCVTLNSTTTSSPTYTVKNGAAHGNHTYTISAGSCGSAHLGPPDTGGQTITVDTSSLHGHKKAAY
jgi:hypothetical protein